MCIRDRSGESSLDNRHGKIAAEVNKRLGATGGNDDGGNTGGGGTTTTVFKTGDVVKITGTTYYSGAAIPAWVKAKNWVVHEMSHWTIDYESSHPEENEH